MTYIARNISKITLNILLNCNSGDIRCEFGKCYGLLFGYFDRITRTYLSFNFLNHVNEGFHCFLYICKCCSVSSVLDSSNIIISHPDCYKSFLSNHNTFNLIPV